MLMISAIRIQCKDPIVNKNNLEKEVHDLKHVLKSHEILKDEQKTGFSMKRWRIWINAGRCECNARDMYYIVCG